jgi:hypothetical protein
MSDKAGNWRAYIGFEEGRLRERGPMKRQGIWDKVSRPVGNLQEGYREGVVWGVM